MALDEINDKVATIGGTFLSDIALAVTDLASQKKVFETGSRR